MVDRNLPDAVRGLGQPPAALNPGDLDCVYGYACQLFDAGDYTGARRCYELLTRLSPGQFNYWLALGLACQRRAEHDEAVVCFGRAGSLRGRDPRPAYHAGVSYRLNGQPERARTAFLAALKGCGERPEHSAFKAEIRRQAQSLFD